MACPAYRLHQTSRIADAWRWAVGMRCGSELNSSSVRTSASTAAPGSPTRRESCATVISVGEGMAASTSDEDMDAMFQPRPHGAIAVDPLGANPHQLGGNVNSSARDDVSSASFLSWRTSLAASATSQSRKVTIFGKGCRGLWTDDPIGLGQTQLLGKRAQQSPGDQIGCRQRGARERNALTVDSGIDGHAHAIEHGTMRELSAADPGRLQPFRPILSVIDMDQGELEHIGRLA